MKILMLVPRVIQRYSAQFPETTNNAYKYFNYDNRIVEERVHRGDAQSQYKGPEEFSDADYDGLVAYAKTLVHPILQKYSPRVACEDALHMAIRSFGNGKFDNKVNANKYTVLLSTMMGAGPAPAAPTMSHPAVVPAPTAQMQQWSPIMAAAKKKKDAPKKDPAKVLSPHILRELGVKTRGLPTLKRKAPAIVREKGKAVIKTK